MDRTLSPLDQMRLQAGLVIGPPQAKKSPAKEESLNEATSTGEPAGSIQHVWLVTGASTDSDLHDVVSLTDINGLINQLIGMVAGYGDSFSSDKRAYFKSQNPVLFPENAKGAAIKEAKARIAAAQGTDDANVTEMSSAAALPPDDINLDMEDKPSTNLMRTKKEGYCEDCECDPCECEEKEAAGKENIDEGKQPVGAVFWADVTRQRNIKKAKKWMRVTEKDAEAAAKKFDVGGAKYLQEAAADESGTAPGKTGINAQNPVKNIFKKESLTNTSKDGETYMDLDSAYPEDAKRQTDGAEEFEEKITIPANIKSDLSARIKELKDLSDKNLNHDMDRARLYGRASYYMQEILDHLDGTKEGMKWAQIHYTKAMGPIQQLIPDNVRTWVARGGEAPSLKQYYTIVKDKST